MPKQLITVIGLIVSLGIVALGVSLVAAPLVAQALSVDVQTSTVASSNAAYEAQVANLQEQQKRQGEIESSVAALQQQIPGSDQFDDVFEVVGRAAETSGVVIVSITAGDIVAFTPRTAADVANTSGAAPTASPEPSPTATDGASADAGAPDGASTDAAPSATAPAAGGRQQVDFAIAVTASDMDQVTAFLDALRAGPRLLSTVKTSATTSGENAIDVQIEALAYTDAKG
jgi:hypothetical protein